MWDKYDLSDMTSLSSSPNTTHYSLSFHLVIGKQKSLLDKEAKEVCSKSQKIIGAGGSESKAAEATKDDPPWGPETAGGSSNEGIEKVKEGWKCLVCQKVFKGKKKTWCAEHYLSSHKEKNMEYRCPACPSRLCSRDSFRKHLKNYHNITIGRDNCELYKHPVDRSFNPAELMRVLSDKKQKSWNIKTSKVISFVQLYCIYYTCDDHL